MWTGAWTGAWRNPSAMCALVALTRGLAQVNRVLRTSVLITCRSRVRASPGVKYTAPIVPWTEDGMAVSPVTQSRTTARSAADPTTVVQANA